MTTATVRLAHEVAGPAGAPVVVLGSSIGTTRDMWTDVLPALTGRFRVVRYDHRGHGGSPVPPGPYRLADLGADVLVLLDELGVERAHHVGLSLGGLVALWLAGHAPERTGRVVGVCTAARFPPAAQWRSRAAAVRAYGTGAVVDRATGRWFTPRFADDPRARACVAGLHEVPDEGYAACCDALATADVSGVLGRVRSPTLMVAGAEDAAAPASRAWEVAAGIRAGGGLCDVAVVPHAAHLAAVEQPEAVAGHVLRHLAGDR